MDPAGASWLEASQSGQLVGQHGQLRCPDHSQATALSSLLSAGGVGLWDPSKRLQFLRDQAERSLEGPRSKRR